MINAETRLRDDPLVLLPYDMKCFAHGLAIQLSLVQSGIGFGMASASMAARVRSR